MSDITEAVDAEDSRMHGHCEEHGLKWLPPQGDILNGSCPFCVISDLRSRLAEKEREVEALRGRLANSPEHFHVQVPDRLTAAEELLRYCEAFIDAIAVYELGDQTLKRRKELLEQIHKFEEERGK